jgi:ferredoxin-type protein NapH
MKPRSAARRAVQLAFAAFYLLLPLANARGLRAVAGNLAWLRIGPLDLAEPAAALSAALAAGWSAPLVRLSVAAAPALLLALLLGPVFCSWVCPFGLVSEGIDRLLRRRGWPARAHERARFPRIAALCAVLAGSAALGVPLGALVQGPRAITAVPQEAFTVGAVSTFSAGLLGILLLLDAVLPRRLFCRALCPAGALANFLRTPRTLRIAFEPSRCGCPGSPACLEACPWGVDPRRAGRFDGCTSCLACLDACPTGALESKLACSSQGSAPGGRLTTGSPPVAPCAGLDRQLPPRRPGHSQ